MYSSEVSQGTLTGWVIGGILVLIINIIICNAIGKSAERKGRDYWPFFWLAFLFGWLMLAIIVYAMPDQNQRFVAYPAQAPKPMPATRVFCASCGQEVGAQDQFCKGCGTHTAKNTQREHYVAPPTTSPVEAFLAQSPSNPGKEMTYVELVDGKCPKCGGTGFVLQRRGGIYRKLCLSC